jgi:putative glutamine amidotransferase
MKRPAIGINTKLVHEGQSAYYKLDRFYTDAIVRAGGEPHILPIFRSRSEAKAWVSRMAGILLTGGADINPRRWGESKHPKTNLLHPEKEQSDLWLAREAMDSSKPLLAICLGSQVVNVVGGGTLIQHMADLEGPNEAHRKGQGNHAVTVAEGSRLHDILGRRHVRVNSFHHQAVAEVGKSLSVNAYADDGIIEGTEGRNSMFELSVQWHPERMGENAVQRRLFGAFVSAARRHR